MRAASTTSLVLIAVLAFAAPGFAAPALTLGGPPPVDDGQGLSLDDPGDQPVEVTGPAVPSKDLLQALYDICIDVAGPDLAAYDRARDAGWSSYDDDVDGGPYRRLYSSFKTFAGYGDVDLTSSVATFGDSQLGYCRLDFNDLGTLIDFADFTGIGGLTGAVAVDATLAHGAWSTPDHRILVIADRTDVGVVEIEFNLLPAAAPQP